jgi:hypothetical protein
MACCAYDRLVRRFSSLPDEQVAAELRGIAALAAVAEDQAFKAAADRMSEAAGEEDRVGVEQAARVFVDEAWRLVPDQRLAIP